MPSKELSELFTSGSSPYFGMYTAGLCGYELQDTISYCMGLGLSIRKKDIKQWERGNFNRAMRSIQIEERKKHKLDPIKKPIVDFSHNINDGLPRFKDLQDLPDGWKGTDKRFFPCTQDNKPMRKWGWSPGFVPQLLTYTDARVLSPCGWVGQNMMYQTFIVLDIDGVGHGERDEAVIQFGNLFRNMTMCMEDPSKQGSFHLYFKTNKMVPIKHISWGKLDIMGNAANAAVYLKNKVSNGLPMAELTEEIWNAVDAYQNKRRETACHSILQAQ